MQTCRVCNTQMNEGYVYEESGDTWCSEVCLRHDYTQEEQAELYNEEGGGMYYSEWENVSTCCKACQTPVGTFTFHIEVGEDWGEKYCSHVCIAEYYEEYEIKEMFDTQVANYRYKERN